MARVGCCCAGEGLHSDPVGSDPAFIFLDCSDPIARRESPPACRLQRISIRGLPVYTSLLIDHTINELPQHVSGSIYTSKSDQGSGCSANSLILSACEGLRYSSFLPWPSPPESACSGSATASLYGAALIQASPTWLPHLPASVDVHSDRIDTERGLTEVPAGSASHEQRHCRVPRLS